MKRLICVPFNPFSNDKDMIKYCCDGRLQYDKELEIQIELMIQKISDLLPRNKLITLLQSNKLFFQNYRFSDRFIVQSIKQKNQYLQLLDSSCKSFDDITEKVLRHYGFDNHRKKPSSSHQNYQKWQIIRKLVFERLEIQSSLKQRSLIFDELIPLKVKQSDLWSEIYHLCRKITKKLKRGYYSLDMITQLEDKLTERQSILEWIIRVIQDEIDMSLARLLELIEGVAQLRAITKKINKLLSPPNTLL